MSKLKKVCNKLLIVCVVVLFIIFSYIKLFTIQVSFSNDPTVSIVKTQDIQWLKNTYRIDKETLPYNWYDNYGFEILYADEMGNTWETVHSLVIIVWWIMMICLVVITIRFIIKNILRN